MKVLGITGGIGSGKTYICDIFRHLGIPAYGSDERARALYLEDERLLKEVQELLGADIVENGVLRTDRIARRIFGSAPLLQQLEALVHPAVLRDFGRWKDRMAEQAQRRGERIPFVIFESAILLQKPSVRRAADRVLTVSAPEEVRIERVMRRDGSDRERVLERISSQWSDRERERLSDFIIFADGKRALLPQIVPVMERMSRTED